MNTYPTLTPTRPASGLHTSPRPSSHTNQSTNDTVQHTTTLHKYHNHTASAPIQPPQKHAPTLHRYHAHATDTTPIRPHNHTTTQTHARRSPGPPTQTQTPSRRRCRTRCTRSHAPVRNSTGQAPDRIRPYKTRQNQARPSHWLCIRRGRSLQIFLPNLTAHYSAMRVVQAPSLALTLFDVPACCRRAQARHIVEPAARQLGGLDAGASQAQAVFDA